MKRILRLYPRGWRERYGDEMESILEERAFGPFELIDLFLGAIDAHLHLRGLGNRSEHRKGITMSLRTAGTAAIIGGALWGLTWLLLAASSNDDGNMPIAFLTLIVAIGAMLVALAGLSAYQARIHRRATWASFLVPAASIGFVFVGLVGMGMADVMYWVAMLGVLGFIGGSMLFGIVTYAVGALSRAAAALLAVGSGVQLVGFAIMFLVADWNSPVQFVAILGMAAGAIGWIALGADAVRRDRSDVLASPTMS